MKDLDVEEKVVTRWEEDYNLSKHSLFSEYLELGELFFPPNTMMYYFNFMSKIYPYSHFSGKKRGKERERKGW